MTSRIGVKKIPTSPYGTNILVGHGTLGMNSISRKVNLQVNFGLQKDVIAVMLANYHTDVFRHAKHLSRFVPTYAPKRMLAQFPHGLRNDPRLAELCRSEWLPEIQKFWDGARYQHTKLGLTAGLVEYDLSGGGGHMAIDRESAAIGLETFERALHLGYFARPVHNRRHWANFQLPGFEHYPDDLGLPLVIYDNDRHFDWVTPTLSNILVAARRLTSTTQASAIEKFSDVMRQHKLAGLAATFQRVAKVPVTWYSRAWNSVQAVTLPTVAQQEIPIVLSKAIFDVFQPENSRIDAPPVSPGMPQFVAVGGLPVFDVRDRSKRELILQLQDETISRAKARFDEAHQLWPSGTEFIWSPVVDEERDTAYVRLPVIRVFPIPGKRARDYINEMLCQEDMDAPDCPLAS